jgi:hypothetical protein
LRYGWRHWLTLLDMHRPSKTAPANPCSDAQAVALLKAFTEFSVLCAVREGPLGVVQLNAHVEHALGTLQHPMSDADLERKFRALVVPSLAGSKADTILQACWSIGKAADAGAALDTATR